MPLDLDLSFDPSRYAGSILSVEDAVAASVGAFRQAEDEIRARLERFVEINLDPTIGQAARADQQRAILARLGIIRAELEGQSVAFATDSMARVYAGGMDRAVRALELAGASPIGSASFAQVHREALEVMALSAYDDLAAATQYMDAAAKRTIREATKLRAMVGVATGEGVPDDARALARTLRRDGVTGFVDRANRNWRLSTYAEMVIRTKSAQAYNTGTVLRAAESGTTAYRIADGERSGHEDCVQYSGKTCSARWALENPIEHPNCVRSFGPLPLHDGPVEYGDPTPEPDSDLGPIEPNVTTYGDPDDPIIRQHLDDLARVPYRWQRALADDGVTFHVGNTPVTSYPPTAHLAGVRPRGWPEGSSWDQVPGAFHHGTGGRGGDVILGGLGPGKPGRGHGSHSLATHETGHALDYALGARFESVSRSAAFRSTYDEVVDHANRQGGLLSGYYRQAYDAGPSELFAEGISAYLSDAAEVQLARLAGTIEGGAALRAFFDAL